MAKNVRLNKKDRVAASRRLAGRSVRFADGTRGEVVRITRASIVVKSMADGKQRPYAVARSFLRGGLTFADKFDQGYFVSLLRKLGVDAFDDSAVDEDLPTADHSPAQSLQASTDKATQQDSSQGNTGESLDSKLTQTQHIDVAGNTRLILFFKNVSEERYLFHMKNVGIAGFEGSIAEGFEKSPFVGLRETERFLGCSLGMLLSTFEEFLRCIFKECVAAKQWDWYEPKSDRLEDGRLHLSVLCKNQDDERSFIVHAVYQDEDMRRCQLMQANFMESRRESFELHTMQFGVLEPNTDTVQGFEDAYGRGGGTVVTRAPIVSRATMSGVASGTTAATRTTPSTPAAKKNASASSSSQTKPIHVNEFLVRRSYGSHRTGGHRLDPIRATVSVLPKSGGDPYPVEFDAYWCPKCRKYFMGEVTYLNLKRKGYICCKVIEEKDLGTKRAGDGLYGNLASESILHMYGYNVNQQDDLSEVERQTIISFVIENRIQSTQDIAHLLEWLIAQRESNPRMSIAVSRWRTDLRFVKRYHKPTRRVRVDRIYAKI